MDFDSEVAAIKAEHFETIRSSPNVWIVEERDGQFIVHHWSAGGVSPTSTYPSLRLAAGRLLQLFHIGPVAPQTWPETACIGAVDLGPPGEAH